MKHLPRITIITPSLNQGMFIGRTIYSVICQAYPDLEYIVIDGGSTDNTLDVLSNYEDNISWISEIDRGQAHAINKGLKLATGDVVGFLNSDDTLEPGALRIIGQFFQKNPGSYWMTGKCRIIDQNNKEIRKLITFYKNFWLYVNKYKLLLILDYISQPATFWRREATETIGYFDESLTYALDYDYWLRLGKHYNLCFLPNYLACFRVHQLSKGGTQTQSQFDEIQMTANRYHSSKIIRYLHHYHKLIMMAVYKRQLIK